MACIRSKRLCVRSAPEGPNPAAPPAIPPHVEQWIEHHRKPKSPRRIAPYRMSSQNRPIKQLAGSAADADRLTQDYLATQLNLNRYSPSIRDIPMKNAWDASTVASTMHTRTMVTYQRTERGAGTAAGSSSSSSSSMSWDKEDDEEDESTDTRNSLRRVASRSPTPRPALVPSNSVVIRVTNANDEEKWGNAAWEKEAKLLSSALQVAADHADADGEDEVEARKVTTRQLRPRKFTSSTADPRLRRSKSCTRHQKTCRNSSPEV